MCFIYRTKADIQSLLYIPSALTVAVLISQNCTFDTSLLNKLHNIKIKHQKSLSLDHSMKLAFDVDKFVTTVQSIAPEFGNMFVNLHCR